MDFDCFLQIADRSFTVLDLVTEDFGGNRRLKAPKQRTRIQNVRTYN